ncbi:hypothetical protein THOM_1274 [Trachipleistophora hominis]|uniref:Uncharacterized protein n=1 Tax=Trachipleistophora hominis TaxID=72359 RepID=L7JXH9_TRAHO|nr:hypothetical protein THOM_1274 [Trachipleistophora hominis]
MLLSFLSLIPLRQRSTCSPSCLTLHQKYSDRDLLTIPTMFHNSFKYGRFSLQPKQEQKIRMTPMTRYNDLPDKENYDPLAECYSPHAKKTGSIRRAILKDITDKYRKRVVEEKEPVDEPKKWSEEIEELFGRWKDSPVKKKSMREI